MKLALVFMLLLLVSGCVNSGDVEEVASTSVRIVKCWKDHPFEVYYDKGANVTCWSFDNYATGTQLECLEGNYCE